MKKYSWRKIISHVNQKITLVFFSKEMKKASTNIWDVKTFIYLGVVFIAMITLSIHYLITNQSRQDLLKQAEVQNLKLDKQIEKLNLQINKISEFQTKYSQQMLKIYQHFGDINGKSVWEKSARNEDIELIKDTWKLKNIDWLNPPDSYINSFNSLEKINQSRIQLLLNINQLKEIDRYMALAEKISDHIPIGWPVQGNQGYKTSGFGARLSPFSKKREFHTGVDIASYPGNKLLATADGVVLFSGKKGAFGNVVIIRHDFGYRTIYAHNNENLVKNGQQIKKGHVIALLGNTGRSTGAHVHYEIRIGKQYVDPWPYVVSKFY